MAASVSASPPRETARRMASLTLVQHGIVWYNSQLRRLRPSGVAGMKTGERASPTNLGTSLRWFFLERFENMRRTKGTVEAKRTSDEFTPP